MEEKYNDSTINRPAGDRAVDAPLVLIDIPDFIKKIKKEKAWHESDRNAITIFKSNKLSIVLVALKRKSEMTTERPENIFSLQVIKGRIKLNAAEKNIEVCAKEIFILHENIPYKITAIKKSIFLLTVVE